MEYSNSETKINRLTFGDDLINRREKAPTNKNVTLSFKVTGHFSTTDQAFSLSRNHTDKLSRIH